MSNQCVQCEADMDDTAYACARCASLAAEKLAVVVQLTPEARAVSWGLSGRSEGGGSGKPGSRSPGNDDAMDALGEVQNTLTTWARHVAEERGGDLYPVGPTDPIVIAAEALRVQVEWLRHRAEVDEAFRDFAQAAGRMRYVVDGPGAKKYLGPCGAPYLCDGIAVGDQGQPCAECGAPESHPAHELRTCEGDVYGPAGGRSGRCRTCGAEVDQGERRAWLDEQVRDKAFRLAHIADAYGLKLKTLRDWAAERPEVRAENGAIIRSAKPAKLRVHGMDLQGKQLFLVGDVLDLAREAARKRAENEARREQREVAA
jgi:hypothetical protein